MAPKYQNYYKILGVRRTAGVEAIHKAFRRLARKYHPDVNPGNKTAEERFKNITEAYEVLSDPEKRREYDIHGEDWRTGQGPPTSAAGQGYVRGVRPEAFESYETKPGLFRGFFRSLFGGRARPGWGYSSPGSDRAGGTPQRGVNIEADVTIPLDRAFQGGTTGVAVRVPEAAPDGTIQHTTRKYEVKIPPGTREGARIRLAGQGRPAKEGTPPGDLIIRVHITPHPVFRLRGGDVEMDLAITPWEAALGTKVSVPTLDGPVEMTLPAGSQSGRRMRLRGKGMPLSNGRRADQYVVLKIVVPEQLTGFDGHCGPQHLVSYSISAAPTDITSVTLTVSPRSSVTTTE